VLELLLLDAGNPRSLVYQLDRLIEDLAALPLGSSSRLRPEQRLVLEASSTLRLADLADLVGEDEDGTRPALTALLGRLVELLLKAGTAVDTTHFVHTVPTFALLGPAGAEPSIVRGG